jgi:hypothetical protein
MLIQQGHKFEYFGREVLALESGDRTVMIAVIDHTRPYPLGKPQMAEAARLVPLPMRYFHGALPS